MESHPLLVNCIIELDVLLLEIEVEKQAGVAIIGINQEVQRGFIHDFSERFCCGALGCQL
jgi:hypothetical protein